MKILKYLSAAVLSLLISASCAEADEETIHTDNTISSIQISPVDTSIPPVEGQIDEANHTILFPIPRRYRNDYDLTRLNVRATIAYDAYITPVLTGLHDLSEPFRITVTAGNREQREYTLQAFYSREDDEEE